MNTCKENHIFFAVIMHAQHTPLTPLTQPHTKTHMHSYTHTHKRKSGENVENHNENFNLRKEQPASAWGWVNSGLLYFMPPHHWGPLCALSSFRTSTTPFTAQRCLLASSVPSHPLCEEDLNQGKPKQCTMDPPPPPMIQLMKREEYGWRGWWERKGGGGGDGEEGRRAGI